MATRNQPFSETESQPDVILIGAGIMSATLGVMLKELQPDLKIEIFERLDEVAAESSDAWNNAGTGHSAFCELNYTPELPDGTVESSKTLKIAESFDLSRQFWSFLVENGYISDPHTFINSIPHISFVWGAENVAYLKKRYEAMHTSHFFSTMQYSQDPEVLKTWMPLVMEGRDPEQPVAATRIDLGTDVNFGNLTRTLFSHLIKKEGVHLQLGHEVRDLEQDEHLRWKVTVKDKNSRKKRVVTARFVFIGAGGGSLHLLEKANIPEADGFGGFPVGGQWLRCNNEEVIEKHFAKVYGKAAVGSPPMSVPHLDTRMIDGKKALLFGPYAGFSTKFLKKGSLLDLPLSITLDNLRPMISVGLHNMPLTKYLIEQVLQSMDDKLDALREYLPLAQKEDWELEIAGQRVQVIKKDPTHEHGGVLEFGTEVVSASDGSLAALLGASPGASTAVSIMLDVLSHCFPDELHTDRWQNKMKQMIPSYGQSLAHNPELYHSVMNHTAAILGLTVLPV